MAAPKKKELVRRPAVPKRKFYDRDAAVSYALRFVLLPCSDGFVALKPENSPAPHYHEFLPLTLKRELEAHHELTMDDCTHFISCCIGSPFDASAIGETSVHRPPPDSRSPRVKAGGLRIPSGTLGNPWMYGLIGVPTLTNYLVDESGYGEFVTLQYSLGSEGLPGKTDFEPGDLIVKYGRDATSGSPTYTPSHLMMYVGDWKRKTPRAGEDPNTIHSWFACHTACRVDTFPIGADDSYRFIRLG